MEKEIEEKKVGERSVMVMICCKAEVKINTMGGVVHKFSFLVK